MTITAVAPSLTPTLTAPVAPADFAPQTAVTQTPSTGSSSELWGWSNPDLPAQNQFLTGIQDSPNDARVDMARQAGLALPVGWRDMSLDQFLDWAGGSKDTKEKAVDPPLSVRAHSYENEKTHRQVVVSSLTVDETGDFRQRRENDNPGRARDVDVSFAEARAGHYYTITTRWADGRTQETQIRDQGYPIEIW